MLFLSDFQLPTQEQEHFFFTPPPLNPNYKVKNYRTIYESKYPFFLFEGRGMPPLVFDDITILYGNNGSGKSTVLNIIAEALSLPRDTPYNRSDYFDDYTELCAATVIEDMSADSCIITSDDVFDRVLDIRRLNEGIDNKREMLLREFIEERSDDNPNLLTGLEQYEQWHRKSSMRNRHTTSSSFLRKNLIRNVQERSNGESALFFFVDKIADGGLYLLDEPENSLSPSNQLQLKYFIEDCVRNHNCQFIISTHSPFLLSLQHAKIYDLDRVPIEPVDSWKELEAVRVYFDFFEKNR